MKRAASTRWESPKHLFAILLTLAALLAVSALGLAVPQEARAATAFEKLSQLSVRPAGSVDGYSRDLFPHWSDAQEYGWRLPAGAPDPGPSDIREAALIRGGKEEVVGSGCSVGSGRWLDPYTGNAY